ncbi:hypothetical protein B0H15DRAFT_565420 [Mycena belliarum]|uniref:DUF6699 domain-containing protein n=1 Tax=Mycena belliarum TaxID=1033014 RepID=A0AAD6TS04_9AGAR|nr:hypothetical protein B0H15DRAFT_565420 [Mycena belliae]
MNPAWGVPWQQPAYYQQPHPGAFSPPPAGFPGYWSQPGWAPPNTNAAYHSTKYPMLNPVLASDSTQIRYDVRKQARNEIPPATYMPNRLLHATATSATHVRLISKAFPWSIDIKSNTPITCEAVWDALHAALQQHIADSEWGIVVGDKKQREMIEKAAKKRVESDPDARLKRIDWLGVNTIFRGLDRMEDFQELRLMPGAEPCLETWVVKLGSS